MQSFGKVVFAFQCISEADHHLQTRGILAAVGGSTYGTQGL